MFCFCREPSQKRSKTIIGFIARNTINFQAFIDSFKKIYEVAEFEIKGCKLRYKNNHFYVKGYFELELPEDIANKIKQKSERNEPVLDQFNIYINNNAPTERPQSVFGLVLGTQDQAMIHTAATIHHPNRVPGTIKRSKIY